MDVSELVKQLLPILVPLLLYLVKASEKAAEEAGKDETLARELVPLVQSLEHTHVTVIASGDRSVAVGGSVSGSVIRTGDANV
ncbi:MAG: hypothetical protein N2559_17970 [Anaerolineae bacterium]|nr:hypothetical protein [Anaerolineae bacterium]